MSIQTKPIRKLIDTLTTDTLVIAGGVVTIQGLPSFLVADISNCYRACPAACVKQVTTVAPALPTAACECPWVWEMNVSRIFCNTSAQSHEIPEYPGYYSYQDPAGGTPTLAAIAASIVAQVNSNPYSSVTAAVAGNTIVLTEKDCDTEARTCGFTVETSSGTVTYTGGANVVHVDAILSAPDIARNFPILPGQFGSRPALAMCGTYCKYGFRAKLSQVHDSHLQNALTDRYMDFEIWVDSSLANFLADWDNELVAEADCFGAALT